MDPEAALQTIRYCIKELLDGENSDEANKHYAEALVEHFDGLDKWLCDGGFIPREWVSTHCNRDAKANIRMSDAQRNRLWDMCGNYGVPFREDDYTRPHTEPRFVEGWIGGKPGTIYTGVSPKGESHT